MRREGNDAKQKQGFAFAEEEAEEVELRIAVDEMSADSSRYKVYLNTCQHSMHVMWMQYERNVHPTCGYRARNMHTTCVQPQVACIQHLHNMHVVCMQHACGMLAPLVHHACNMHASCLHHACTMHGRLEPTCRLARMLHGGVVQTATRTTTFATVGVMFANSRRCGTVMSMPKPSAH